MPKVNIVILLIVSVLQLTNALSQTLTPHSVPEEFTSDYYIVEANGTSIPVFHAGLNTYFASFDFEGEAQVKVTSNYRTGKYSGQTANKDLPKVDERGYWRGEAIIRPISKNIKATLNDLTASFTISQSGQYSVERTGTSNFKDDVIFIFANRPDLTLPDFSRPDVIRLKPGIHQQHIDLQSGQTLYLDPGAVLFGSINVWDAKDVKILGRGTVVYYGPQAETRDDGWKHLKNWHPLTTHNVTGLTVQGVTFVGRSRTWSLQTYQTFDAIFDNIKVIAVNPQNLNGDGIDWYGGGRTKVVNSFIRSMDDCFAFFTPESSLDIWSVEKTTMGSVKDIEIDNCVLWPSVANIFRIGFTGQALETSNITMKNTDVIHISKGFWHAPNALLCAVSTNNKGKAQHKNYRMEDIRIEEPMALLGLQNPEASFYDVLLTNITMSAEPVPMLIKSSVRNVSFNHVKLNGTMITSKEQLVIDEESTSRDGVVIK